MITLKSRLLVLAVTILFAACAHQTSMSTRSSTRALSDWELKAKVGFKRAQTAQSANMIWKKENTSDDILLFGPFGAGKVRILQTPEHATLIDGETHHEAEDPAALLQELTGIVFPVEQLNWWIQGLPAPDTERSDSTLDEGGRLSHFKQSDWHIHYLRYADLSERALPTKIKLKNAEYSLTIVIQSWKHSRQNINN
jgi:outer membrane lipoprotein LolB